MDIGKAVKELRRVKNFSQVELAEKASISQTALSQIETGRKRPGKATLETICSALGVPVSMMYTYAFEREDVPKEKRVLYDQLFPVIQLLVTQLVVKKEID